MQAQFCAGIEIRPHAPILSSSLPAAFQFEFMSYKHNNLMAMRNSYWNDLNPQVIKEKLHFQQMLVDNGIFETATAEDAKHLFFSLPSIIIVKGYAHGFMHASVQTLICQHIQANRQFLQQKTEMKIKFNL